MRRRMRRLFAERGRVAPSGASCRRRGRGAEGAVWAVFACRGWDRRVLGRSEGLGEDAEGDRSGRFEAVRGVTSRSGGWDGFGRTRVGPFWGDGSVGRGPRRALGAPGGPCWFLVDRRFGPL